MKLISILVIAAIVAGLTLSARAAAPELKQEDLPLVPPVEKYKVFKTFQIRKGFHVEEAAAEPLVVDPIEICFDEN